MNAKIDVQKWEYLNHLKKEEVDFDVELMVDCNVPQAMDAWEAINSSKKKLRTLCF